MEESVDKSANNSCLSLRQSTYRENPPSIFSSSSRATDEARTTAHSLTLGENKRRIVTPSPLCPGQSHNSHPNTHLKIGRVQHTHTHTQCDHHTITHSRIQILRTRGLRQEWVSQTHKNEWFNSVITAPIVMTFLYVNY